MMWFFFFGGTNIWVQTWVFCLRLHILSEKRIWLFLSTPAFIYNWIQNGCFCSYLVLKQLNCTFCKVNLQYEFLRVGFLHSVESEVFSLYSLPVDITSIGGRGCLNWSDAFVIRIMDGLYGTDGVGDCCGGGVHRATGVPVGASSFNTSFSALI